MISEEAIKLLQQAESIKQADVSVSTAFSGEGLLALPQEFKLHDIEGKLPQRRRQRGTMSTSCIDSFCAYTEAHAENGASVFVGDDMSARAVLNLGTQEAPGHGDNQGVLALVKSAAFDALLGVNGKPLNQKEAAEFLEDWNDCVTFFQGADKLEPGKAIAAVRKITVESARKLESTTQNFSDTASAFEQVTASSVEPLPELVYFKTIPFEGLPERTFVLRVGILTGDDKPRLVLRMQRLQMHVQEMANELAHIVTQELGNEHITVVRGSFRRAD